MRFPLRTSRRNAHARSALRSFARVKSLVDNYVLGAEGGALFDEDDEFDLGEDGSWLVVA